MRIGLVGYGTGGRYFHAPFISAAEGVSLAGRVATHRRRSRRSKPICLNRLAVRELLVYGEGGSYVSSGTNVQAQAIFAGLRPAADLAGWGYESPEPPKLPELPQLPRRLATTIKMTFQSPRM